MDQMYIYVNVLSEVTTLNIWDFPLRLGIISLSTKKLFFTEMAEVYITLSSFPSILTLMPRMDINST